MAHICCARPRESFAEGRNVGLGGRRTLPCRKGIYLGIFISFMDLVCYIRESEGLREEEGHAFEILLVAVLARVLAHVGIVPFDAQPASAGPRYGTDVAHCAEGGGVGEALAEVEGPCRRRSRRGGHDGRLEMEKRNLASWRYCLN